MNECPDHNSSSVLLQLLEKARTGDRSAREVLFEQCRNYVHILARTQMESWMRTKVDASDLVQQTLLDAHRGLENFRGESEGEWLAWLRQILTHNAQDIVRRYCLAEKRCVHKEVSLDGPQQVGADSFARDLADHLGETPSQLLSQQEQEVALANALMQLREDYRDVILLRNLQRLSFQQVAERMQRSRPAAQMLWLRAMKDLGQLMGAQ